MIATSTPQFVPSEQFGASFVPSGPAQHDDLFRKVYFRNNKGKRQGGQKNLRCFPQCGGQFGQHANHGFCGLPMRVKCHYNYNNANLCCFGRFHSSNFDAKIDLVCSVGDIIDKEILLGDLRTSQNPLAQWWPGVVMAPNPGTKANDLGSCVFEFNSEKKGWHYGFNSNRFSDQVHSFLVYFFAVNDGKCTCVHVLESDRFNIQSQRRATKDSKTKKSVAKVPPKKRELDMRPHSPPVEKRLRNGDNVAFPAAENVNDSFPESEVHNDMSTYLEKLFGAKCTPDRDTGNCQLQLFDDPAIMNSIINSGVNLSPSPTDDEQLMLSTHDEIEEWAPVPREIDQNVWSMSSCGRKQCEGTCSKDESEDEREDESEGESEDERKGGSDTAEEMDGESNGNAWPIGAPSNLYMKMDSRAALAGEKSRVTANVVPYPSITGPAVREANASSRTRRMSSASSSEAVPTVERVTLERVRTAQSKNGAPNDDGMHHRSLIPAGSTNPTATAATNSTNGAADEDDERGIGNSEHDVLLRTLVAHASDARHFSLALLVLAFLLLGIITVDRVVGVPPIMVAGAICCGCFVGRCIQTDSDMYSYVASALQWLRQLYAVSAYQGPAAATSAVLRQCFTHRSGPYNPARRRKQMIGWSAGLLVVLLLLLVGHTIAADNHDFSTRVGHTIAADFVAKNHDFVAKNHRGMKPLRDDDLGHEWIFDENLAETSGGGGLVPPHEHNTHEHYTDSHHHGHHGGTGGGPGKHGHHGPGKQGHGEFAEGSDTRVAVANGAGEASLAPIKRDGWFREWPQQDFLEARIQEVHEDVPGKSSHGRKLTRQTAPPRSLKSLRGAKGSKARAQRTADLKAAVEALMGIDEPKGKRKVLDIAGFSTPAELLEQLLMASRRST
jgi:hypothetical protein